MTADLYFQLWFVVIEGQASKYQSSCTATLSWRCVKVLNNQLETPPHRVSLYNLTWEVKLHNVIVMRDFPGCDFSSCGFIFELLPCMIFARPTAILAWDSLGFFSNSFFVKATLSLFFFLTFACHLFSAALFASSFLYFCTSASILLKLLAFQAKSQQGWLNVIWLFSRLLSLFPFMSCLSERDQGYNLSSN